MKSEVYTNYFEKNRDLITKMLGQGINIYPVSRSIPQKLFECSPLSLRHLYEVDAYQTNRDPYDLDTDLVEAFMSYSVYNYYFNDYASRLSTYGDRLIDPYLYKMKQANIAPVFFQSLLRPDEGVSQKPVKTNGSKSRLETSYERRDLCMINQWTYGWDNCHAKLKLKRFLFDKIKFELLGEGSLGL